MSTMRSLMLLVLSCITVAASISTAGPRSLAFTSGFRLMSGPSHHQLQHRSPHHSQSIAAAAAAASRRRRIFTMRLNPRDDNVSIGDRIFSIAPYVLPIMDGLSYSKFLEFYAPQVFAPIYFLLNPLLSVYKASPFASLAFYLILVYIGRSSALSRFVRFNVQQAIILDVALVLPSLITSFLREASAPAYVQEIFNNLLFFILAASVGYVFFSIVKGEKPSNIPIISDAAEMTLGPF